jgi:hypothetical protein
MANDAARHISPEGLATLEVELRELETTDLGTEAIDRRAGDAVASGKSDSAEGPIRATAMDDAQSSASGAKLAAAFRQERVCPPSQCGANF